MWKWLIGAAALYSGPEIALYTFRLYAVEIVLVAVVVLVCFFLMIKKMNTLLCDDSKKIEIFKFNEIICSLIFIVFIYNLSHLFWGYAHEIFYSYEKYMRNLYFIYRMDHRINYFGTRFSAFLLLIPVCFGFGYFFFSKFQKKLFVTVLCMFFSTFFIFLTELRPNYIGLGERARRLRDVDVAAGLMGFIAISTAIFLVIWAGALKNHLVRKETKNANSG